MTPPPAAARFALLVACAALAALPLPHEGEDPGDGYHFDRTESVLHLPPAYLKIPEKRAVFHQANPEQGTSGYTTYEEVSPDEGCDWSPWHVPGSQDSYYHPGSYFEVRTWAWGGPSHQACYDENRNIIKPIVDGDVISPGSADRKAALPFGGTPTGHLNADVKPFIWALQIDGNPAVGVDIYSRLSAPIMHQGKELESYAKLRPAEVPAGYIDLEQCPTSPSGGGDD